MFDLLLTRPGSIFDCPKTAEASSVLLKYGAMPPLDASAGMAMAPIAATVFSTPTQPRHHVVGIWREVAVQQRGRDELRGARSLESAAQSVRGSG